MKVISNLHKFDAATAVLLAVAGIALLAFSEYGFALSVFTCALVSALCAVFKPAQMFTEFLQSRMVSKRKY